jgi:hypothetical protein
MKNRDLSVLNAVPLVYPNRGMGSMGQNGRIDEEKMKVRNRQEEPETIGDIR